MRLRKYDHISEGPLAEILDKMAGALAHFAHNGVQIT